MRELKRRRRSVLKVVEKAASRFPMKVEALGPVMVMTIEEADFPARDSSVVSHLGCPVRARPALYVVNLVAIVERG